MQKPSSCRNPRPAETLIIPYDPYLDHAPSPSKPIPKKPYSQLPQDDPHHLEVVCRLCPHLTALCISAKRDRHLQKSPHMLTGFCTLNFCVAPVLLEIRRLGQTQSLNTCVSVQMLACLTCIRLVKVNCYYRHVMLHCMWRVYKTPQACDVNMV